MKIFREKTNSGINPLFMRMMKSWARNNNRQSQLEETWDEGWDSGREGVDEAIKKSSYLGHQTGLFEGRHAILSNFEKVSDNDKLYTSKNNKYLVYDQTETPIFRKLTDKTDKYKERDSYKKVSFDDKPLFKVRNNHQLFDLSDIERPIAQASTIGDFEHKIRNDLANYKDYDSWGKRYNDNDPTDSMTRYKPWVQNSKKGGDYKNIMNESISKNKQGTHAAFNVSEYIVDNANDKVTIATPRPGGGKAIKTEMSVSEAAVNLLGNRDDKIKLGVKKNPYRKEKIIELNPNVEEVKTPQKSVRQKPLQIEAPKEEPKIKNAKTPSDEPKNKDAKTPNKDPGTKDVKTPSDVPELKPKPKQDLPKSPAQRKQDRNAKALPPIKADLLKNTPENTEKK